MDDVKGWTIFGCTLVVCLATIIISAQFYYRHLDETIARMVESGANPIEAAVALDNTYGDKAALVILARQSIK